MELQLLATARPGRLLNWECRALCFVDEDHCPILRRNISVSSHSFIVGHCGRFQESGRGDDFSVGKIPSHFVCWGILAFVLGLWRARLRVCRRWPGIAALPLLAPWRHPSRMISSFWVPYSILTVQGLCIYFYGRLTLNIVHWFAYDIITFLVQTAFHIVIVVLYISIGLYLEYVYLNMAKC